MNVYIASYDFIKEAAELTRKLTDYVYPSTFDSILEEMDSVREDGWIPIAEVYEYPDGTVSIKVDVMVQGDYNN